MARGALGGIGAVLEVHKVSTHMLVAPRLVPSEIGNVVPFVVGGPDEVHGVDLRATSQGSAPWIHVTQTNTNERQPGSDMLKRTGLPQGGDPTRSTEIHRLYDMCTSGRDEPGRGRSSARHSTATNDQAPRRRGELWIQFSRRILKDHTETDSTGRTCNRSSDLSPPASIRKTEFPLEAKFALFLVSPRLM